ncbi:FitA-like ribbon-helix-helix domain-containing protein [Nocardioides flavescens]|uniref:Arc family DNA-binding protein n=1 Tax=Nocardioides flavescens TaxID=2691959 RepID=A0A6L7ENN7_9ACTN|nr:Arc family DNA-binding protein [Nocardioides flavescens]MXG88957.1 Arc family DNA-binding protein [Nocardioides flavescens]
MEQIVVRNLPPGTKAMLKARAERHHRSTEAEVRAIIADSLDRASISLVDLVATDDVGVDFEFEPERLGATARDSEL